MLFQHLSGSTASGCVHHDPARDGHHQLELISCFQCCFDITSLHSPVCIVAGFWFGAITCLSWAVGMLIDLSVLSFLVAIPSAIKVFNWTATLYKGPFPTRHLCSTPRLYRVVRIGG